MPRTWNVTQWMQSRHGNKQVCEQFTSSAVVVLFKQLLPMLSLRELLTCSEDVLPVVDPDELALCRNAASEEELSKSRMKKKIRGYFREDGSKFRRCWKDQQTCSPSSFLAITSGGLVRRWCRHRNSLSSDAASRWSGTTSRGSILWCCSGYFMWLGCAKCRLWHFALPRTAFEVE